MILSNIYKNNIIIAVLDQVELAGNKVRVESKVNLGGVEVGNNIGSIGQK